MISHLLYLLRTYPRSFLFCLRYLPFRQALHVPVILGKVRVGILRRGDLEIDGGAGHGSIVLGMAGSEGRGEGKFYLSVRNGGRLRLGSNVTMAVGTSVVIDGAVMAIGSNFFCNAGCNFYCTRDITLGSDCLFGWNVEMNTSDGHRIFYDGVSKEHEGEITLGNHVWVCSGTHIGKNVTIADGCVIAQRSLVIKRHLTPGCLIGGIPARDIRGGVSWKA